MNEKHESENFDLVEYQLSLCDEETRLALDQSARPSPARFHAVARGESVWTARERKAIDADPRLRAFEARMQATVKAAKLGWVTVRMNRVAKAVENGPELRAAARGACLASDTVRLVNTEEGYEVELFPADENGLTSVHFVGSVPKTPLGLMVGVSPVDFVEPVDEDGYAVVHAKDVRPVREGVAELHVRVE